MRPALPRLAVLDLAGTTFEEDGRVPALIQRTLAAVGRPASPEAIAEVRGASKRDAFERLAGEPGLGERLYQRFLSEIGRSYERAPPRVIAGAPETLCWLRRHQIKVALNTGFERRIVAPLLRAAGWGSELVDIVVCGDEVKQGRPAPDMIHEAMRRAGEADPGAVLVAGDSVLDLEAGWAARAGWIIGVASGAHAVELLATAPHTHLLASVAEIPALLEAAQPLRP